MPRLVLANPGSPSDKETLCACRNHAKSRGTIFYRGGPSKSLKIGPGGPHKMGDQIFYDRPHSKLTNINCSVLASIVLESGWHLLARSR